MYSLSNYQIKSEILLMPSPMGCRANLMDGNCFKRDNSVSPESYYPRLPQMRWACQMQITRCSGPSLMRVMDVPDSHDKTWLLSCISDHVRLKLSHNVENICWEANRSSGLRGYWYRVEGCISTRVLCRTCRIWRVSDSALIKWHYSEGKCRLTRLARFNI